MTDRERQILTFIRTAPSYRVLALYAMLAYDNPTFAAALADDLTGKTRGEYKRAIKHLRYLQSNVDTDEAQRTYCEDSIAYIRRELMKGGAAA